VGELGLAPPPLSSRSQPFRSRLRWRATFARTRARSGPSEPQRRVAPAVQHAPPLPACEERACPGLDPGSTREARRVKGTLNYALNLTLAYEDGTVC